MSESAQLTQTSQAMEAELAKTAAVYQTDPNKAVDRVPLKPEEKERVKEEVRKKMAALEEVDIYSGDTEGISKAFAQIFDRAAANKQATSDLANDFTKRNFRGAQDSEGFKAVTELAEALRKYDPSGFDLSEPEGWTKWLPGSARKGINNYMRSFKEAQGQIEKLMDGVSGVAEDGRKSKTELEVFDGKLLRLAKELRIQYETFTEIATSVDVYLADLRERDPTKAEKVESELRYRVSEARLDTMTTLLQALNGSILVSSLKKTQDMVITGAERASSSGRLILTINQTAATAASEQQKAADLLEAVNGTIDKMTVGTSELVHEHAKRMKELASSPLGQAEKLRQAFQLGFQTLDELKDVQKQVTERMNSNIDSMNQVYKEASEKIKAQQQATGAFNEIVRSGEALAKQTATLEATSTPEAGRKAPGM